MNDDSTEQNLPLFLTDPVEGTEKPGTPAILKILIVFLTAATLGVGIVAMAGPATQFATAAATWVGLPTPQPDDRQPAPALASTVDAQAPSAMSDTPSPQNAAAASASADARTAETAVPSAGDVLKQFQAWAADHDTNAQPAPAAPAQPQPAPSAEPVQLVQSVPDAPAKVEPRPPAPVRATPKQRPAKSFQNARAEVRPVREARPKTPRAPRVLQRPNPEEEASVMQPPVQSAEPPSLLQIFGLRN
jgi:hypothetical protein